MRYRRPKSFRRNTYKKAGRGSVVANQKSHIGSETSYQQSGMELGECDAARPVLRPVQLERESCEVLVTGSGLATDDAIFFLAAAAGVVGTAVSSVNPALLFS